MYENNSTTWGNPDGTPLPSFLPITKTTNDHGNAECAPEPVPVPPPGDAMGLERQPCSAGPAVEQHDLSVKARPGFNAVLNMLEFADLHDEACAIRNHVKHITWWAQEEGFAARNARAALTQARQQLASREGEHKAQMMRLIDLTSNYCHEDDTVLSTAVRERLIAQSVK